MMTNLYSVAFYPSQDCLESIKEMKTSLKEAIGWYPSANSDGHFTVNVFTADGVQIDSIVKYLDAFARRAKPGHVTVKSGGASAQTLFLAPDEESGSRLKEMMSLINNSFPVRAHKSYDPHISIARQLSGDRMSKAKSLLAVESMKLGFECDRISLRKFDPYQQQYRRVRDFVFTNEEIEVTQLSLF